MKIYVNKEEFMQYVKLQNGALSIDGLESKVIPLQKVLYLIKPLLNINQITHHCSLDEKIWSIFCSPQIRRGSMDNLSSADVIQYRSKIAACIKKEEPIKMIFIAFPFKSYYNPLKTNRHLPDLGELYFLRRLLQINASVSLIYPPGLQWTILTEGRAYANIVGLSCSEVNDYQSSIASFVRIIGAENIIKLDDLARLFELVPDFEEKVVEQHDKLTKQYEQGGATSVSPEFEQILCTMRGSVDLRNDNVENLYHLITADSLVELPSHLLDRSQVISAQALAMALRYQAINQVKNIIGYSGQGLIRDNFSEHCYVSITSKPGRYAFNPLSVDSKFFPHHGVPLLVGKKNGYVRVVFLIDIVTRPQRYRAVYIENDHENKPFFYHQREVAKNRLSGFKGAWET